MLNHKGLQDWDRLVSSSGMFVVDGVNALTSMGTHSEAELKGSFKALKTTLAAHVSWLLANKHVCVTANLHTRQRYEGKIRSSNAAGEAGSSLFTQIRRKKRTGEETDAVIRTMSQS